MKIHFIALGGSIMHNLALDAHYKGHTVTGSDDEIFEPSRSRLAQQGLLPDSLGWFPEKITKDLDQVIVGMHARTDNPELQKAQALGLPIYSYPQYIFENARHKHRVVIAGSHGKTTITAMVMHVLEKMGRQFDYLVGAAPEGFAQNIRLSEEAPLIVLEGDEYPSAPFDPTPKFLHYRHHIGVITGIAWDHVNVYPTFEDYIEPFEQFADATPKAGTLILSQDDSLASVIGAKDRADVNQVSYQAHPHRVAEGITYLVTKEDRIPLPIFGEHNMRNLSAALQVCKRVGVKDSEFYRAIASFKGAARRLEKVAEYNDFIFFKDFAHAPSKLMATTTAVKKQFIDRKLVACLELHSYSSLNKAFLEQYQGTFNAADRAYVYFNPKNIQLKKLEPIQAEEIAQAFDHDHLRVFENMEDLRQELLKINWTNRNLLMMSSGNFDNLDMRALSEEIIQSLK
ncbi:MAG: Mur ligase family protein [Microscillaceae bacterium]